MSSNTSASFKRFINLLAFVAIVAIAVVLIIQAIVGAGEFSNALNIVAQCIAYLVVAVYAFYFVYSKRNVVYTIIYFVAVIIIIILLII